MQTKELGLILLIALLAINLIAFVPYDKEGIYGELNGVDSTVTITDPDTYYMLDNNAGLLNGFHFIDSNLIAEHDGIYLIVGQYAFSGSTNQEYHLTIFINGVQERKCHTERKMGGGDVGSSSYTCLTDLYINDSIVMAIENSGATGDAIIHDSQLTVLKIGDINTDYVYRESI